MNEDKYSSMNDSKRWIGGSELPIIDPVVLAQILEGAVKLQNETCNVFTNDNFCDDRPLYRLLMGRLFILMLFLCILGNGLNLIIYHSQQMRQFLAVRLLSAKMLMNTLLMACLIPQALRLCQSWSSESDAEEIYWQTWPYQMYLINVLGFCSMWMTVLMTVEYFMHVALPSLSKSWCNEANVCKCAVAIILIAISLHLNYPLNRIIRQIPCPGDRIFYKVYARLGAIPIALEKAFAWLNLLLAIVLPLMLLTFMSLYIAWRLLFKYRYFQQHHSTEKHCVTRITLVTTALQLICAGPAVPLFVISALSSPNMMNDLLTCYCYTIAHFLGLCNLSLSFYIYLIFSDKFRSLFAAKLENFRNKYPSLRSSAGRENETRTLNLPTEESTLFIWRRPPRTLSYVSTTTL